MQRVVIVEDSLLLRESLSGWLEKDFEVLATHNPFKALKSLDKQAPDWLLVNPLLACNSGLELLYEVSSWPDWRKTRVILLTFDTEYCRRHLLALKELNVFAILALSDLNANRLRFLLSQRQRSLL